MVDLSNLRSWKGVPIGELTVADRVCGFIETHLKIPEGRRVGEPFILDPFQREFLYAVFDNPVRKTRRAILSMARKNGKTALIAAILLAYVVGPLWVRNAQIVSGAMSRDQAALVFELAVKMLRLSPVLDAQCRVVPSGKKIVGLATGVTYHATSADAATAMGKSPLVVILDEAGQVQGPISPFVEALITSQGAYEDPLQIVISTQAATDADMLSLWIDDALSGEDPAQVVRLYAAPADCELDDVEAWRMSNPGLGTIRSESDLAAQLMQAIRLPSMENSCRNLLLNQRVQLTSPFLSPSVWERNDGEVRLDLFTSGRPVFAGLDLSARTDLTAAAFAVEDEDANCHLMLVTWTPDDTLKDRGLRDRAPYEVWRKAGLLRTTPGQTVDYDFVVRELADLTSRMNLVKMHYDRWRIEILKAACDRLGIALPLLELGQGFKDMSPAVDAFEARALGGKLCHGGNPVLRWNVSNAVIERDPAGNRKLTKAKSFGRIDGAVAAIMAVRAMDVDGEPVVDVQTMIG